MGVWKHDSHTVGKPQRQGSWIDTVSDSYHVEILSTPKSWNVSLIWVWGIFHQMGVPCCGDSPNLRVDFRYRFPVIEAGIRLRCPNVFKTPCAIDFFIPSWSIVLNFIIFTGNLNYFVCYLLYFSTTQEGSILIVLQKWPWCVFREETKLQILYPQFCGPRIDSRRSSENWAHEAESQRSALCQFARCKAKPKNTMVPQNDLTKLCVLRIEPVWCCRMKVFLSVPRKGRCEVFGLFDRFQTLQIFVTVDVKPAVLLMLRLFVIAQYRRRNLVVTYSIYHDVCESLVLSVQFWCCGTGLCLQNWLPWKGAGVLKWSCISVLKMITLTQSSERWCAVLELGTDRQRYLVYTLRACLFLTHKWLVRTGCSSACFALKSSSSLWRESTCPSSAGLLVSFSGFSAVAEVCGTMEQVFPVRNPG